MSSRSATCLSLLVTLALLPACSDDGSGAAGGGGAGAAGSTSSTSTTDTSATTTSGAAVSSSATSTSGAGGGGPDETVLLTAEECTKSPGAASRCEVYDVTCGGAETLKLELAVYDADPSATPRGLVVLGSSGDGQGYYNFKSRNQLLAAGFSVAERRWPAGWFSGATEGPPQASCRLAAVLRHLRATLPEELPLCASANSGGGAELSFAISWQGAGDVLDFAAPTSSPVHRLDHGCQGDADAAWTAECQSLLSANCPDCLSLGCQLGSAARSLVDVSYGGVPRCTAPGAGDLALLQAASPILGPAGPTFGGVPSHVLIGKLDDGAYAPFAAALRDAVNANGGDMTLSFVDGGIHELDNTTEGEVALRDVLLAECVPRP
jgi:hypothetical protein